jgi:uncharacterized membrane protein
MLLDDRQLSFSRAGTTTVIPLAAIRDLSIGHYPRVMNPAGIDFISVTYDAGDQTRRLFFSPFESWFGLPSGFNRFVGEWFNAIGVAVAAATGRAPDNTPANQLGTPSSSLALAAILFSPLLVAVMSLVSVGFAMTWGLAWTAVLICLVGVGGLVQGVLLMRKRELSDGGRLVLLVGGLCLFTGVLLYAFLKTVREAPPAQASQPRFMIPPLREPRLERPAPSEIPGERSDSGIKD